MDAQAEYLLYCEQVEREVYQEYLASDPVATRIQYVRFTSKSKGRRNGRKRLRRNWKEVHLVRYNNGFHSWHLFPFDEYCTEIIGQFADSDMLRERIVNLWGW